MKDYSVCDLCYLILLGIYSGSLSLLNLLSGLDLLIGLLNNRQSLDTFQPSLNSRILLHGQTSKLILSHPGFKVEVHNIRLLTRKNPISIVRLELLLQNGKASASLSVVSLIRVIVLDIVVVAEPVALSHHGSHGSNQEANPLLDVDSALLAGLLTVAELVLGVVDAEDVVDASQAFPACDVGVGVLKGGNTAIGVDGQEVGALQAVGALAELPKLDIVGNFEGLKENGDLEGVRAGVVGVQSKRLDGRHFGCCD